MKRNLLFVISMLLSLAAWCADEVTFTANTVEGVTMTFTVLDEANKTCRAGGKYDNLQRAYEGAIDRGTKGKVTIPETAKGYSVTEIGNSAFGGCTGVTEFILPNSTIKLRNHAFSNCTKIVSFIIPENVNILYDGVFSGCTSLQTVTFNAKDIGMTENGTGGVANAFYNCSSLKKLIFGPSVTRFTGKMAFENCEALSEIHISDLKAWCNINWKGSGNNPLYYAKNLYLNGSKITDLVIPATIETISGFAFYGCTALKTVTLRDGVEKVGNAAFAFCDNLTTVNIPASVTSLSGAFVNCPSLNKVNITDVAAWCNLTFNRPTNNPLSEAHHLYLLNKEVKHLKIPNGVTKINNNAFYGCESIEIISLPNSVTQLWNEKSATSQVGYAFGKITNLSDFYCYALKVPDTHFTFKDTNIDFATLHVPASVIEDYKNTAPWSDFGKIVAYTKDDPNYDPTMDVDDSGSTAISNVNDDAATNQTPVFDLSGRKLGGQPTAKGVYIVNGRKVLRP